MRHFILDPATGDQLGFIDFDETADTEQDNDLIISSLVQARYIEGPASMYTLERNAGFFDDEHLIVVKDDQGETVLTLEPETHDDEEDEEGEEDDTDEPEEEDDDA